MARIGNRAFVALVLASALLGCVGAYLGIWTYRASQCRMSPDTGAYLAYCGQPKYGDYEHGAFHYNLEPGLMSNLRRAQVMFVGTSQAQFGFSTTATTEFFRKRAARHYVMGFGYTEGSVFPAALIDRFHLTPRVVVISTDNFPMGRLSQPAFDVMSRDLRPWLDYRAKFAANRIARGLCAMLPALCSREHGALFRSAANGHWLLDQYGPQANLPIGASNPMTLSPETIAGRLQDAQTLARHLRIAGDCIVVTAPPNGITDFSPLARDIARTLGAHAVLPQLEGLATIDTAHLTRDSAERWSAAVLAEIGPVLDRCLR